MESAENTAIEFHRADISTPDWAAQCDQAAWDGVFLLAVLHHIPSHTLRIRLLQSIAKLLKPQGSLYLSVWQPQNSPKLWARRQNWDAAGFKTDEVDEGDVLLDWRAERTEADKTALRYVHIFQSVELRLLAKSCGFTLKEEYLSDGKEKNLAMYQRWVKHIGDEQPKGG
jgi:SAM-dependent methyltransferase